MTAGGNSRIWNPAEGPTFLYTVTPTTWGWCGLATRGPGLYRASMCSESPNLALEALRLPASAAQAPEHPVLKSAQAFVQRYFAGRQTELDVPLDLAGLTAFTADVLRACSQIRWGDVVSYGDLARLAGHPGTARAVGQVMRRNPVAPFVPCHRVVGADGSLTGFGGGLALKTRLLELEGRKVVAAPGGNWLRVE